MTRQRLLFMFFGFALLIFSNYALSYAFTLPDTGQTSCYNANGNVIACAGTGQDGAYIINPMSYTDNGDGTITDNNTGLMWQKQDAGTEKSLSQTTSYCKSLSLGGYSDWRIPGIMELMSIVDYSTYQPSINSTYFPNTKADYWSDTPTADTEPCIGPCTNNWWQVNFYNGQVRLFASQYSEYARCVRGQGSGDFPEPQLTDNGNGTVTDSITGLMWEQGVVEGCGVTAGGFTNSWTNALSYCNGLSLGGYSDWRLPNIKELTSIVNYAKYSPAIPGNFSCNGGWSSTTDVSSPGNAWSLSVTDGSISSTIKSLSQYARCVRGGQSGPSGTGLVTVTINPGIAIFSAGGWYIKQPDSPQNGLYDTLIGYGSPGDIPITGDWNADGNPDIGVFRGGMWYLKYLYPTGGNNNSGTADLSFGYGIPGDIPIVGDWNGSGHTSIGIFRQGWWYLKNTVVGVAPAGIADNSFAFGLPTDTPVTGDWNGDGITDIGVFRNGVWYLQNMSAGLQPSGIAGTVIDFGMPGDIPITGDWSGTGKSSIGVFRNGTWYLKILNGTDSDNDGTADIVLDYGMSGDVPVVFPPGPIPQVQQ